MNIFDMQKSFITDFVAYLKADTNFQSINMYSNEIIFLQEYELPAILIYTFKNTPLNDRLRDNLDNHERVIDLRIELRGSANFPVEYEILADSLYSALLAFRKTNRLITQVGNPSFQIGLDPTQPGEIAATLDVQLYYVSRKNV